MSDRYVFGKDITRRFYPMEANEPLNLPTQTPTIYIFNSQPSRDKAIAGTDAIETILTWTAASVTPFERTYTISALDDPDADSSSQSAIFWEAINFTTKLSGEIQTVIRAFVVERVEGPDSEPGTTAADLIDIYPAITAYLTPKQLDAHLRLAQDELKIDLEAMGIRWSRVHELSKLKLILAWKTIALSSESQIKTAEDKFDRRADLYNSKYERGLKNVVIPYDSDGDGKVDSKALPAKTYFIIDR